MLESESACRQFLEQQPPSKIARQLRHDQELCQSQRLPSLLALYVPPSKSSLGDAIALQLSSVTLPRSIRALQYNGIVQGVKAYLHHMTPASKHGPLPVTELNAESQPSTNELETALKVLEFYTKNRSSITNSTPLEQVISTFKTQLKSEVFENEEINALSLESLTQSLHPEYKGKWHLRKCYICQFRLSNPHQQYPSLCKPCGDFNLASCNISAPANLYLKGKTALVTGGRVNLGYHTSLRLLRCGARVIVSTRYPRDAETRLIGEKDSSDWSQSLKIVGADFRAAGDVFDMISLVEKCLKEWGEDGKLDILINNAAQTLTDPLDVEKLAVHREGKLRISGNQSGMQLLLDRNYEPRLRGGIKPSQLLGPSDLSFRITSTSDDNIEVQSEISQMTDQNQPSKTLSALPAEVTKSSWMQSINQIPYEDIISAHSVNTFVPLILIRELLPFMGSTSHSHSSSSPSAPLGYIINVSSREGLFESHPTSSSKNGHHVHTNLTKAALNMLTETEAAPAWKQRNVAMNTVDPGYMSAAPEIVEQWRKVGREACPIGWEDGVGRVLWPVAVGEKGSPVWGRFLKHFGKVGVDIGVGR